ncbi:ABC transporter permease [Flexivirga meconopsidis]|uniref:ABC transporter permease n=1 Tax=Flexivirga meconopsidis TaxID=2977121 RepID=UPI00223F4691|nr:ABC transporter permease [Flexivirga meconopsidis]
MNNSAVLQLARRLRRGGGPADRRTWWLSAATVALAVTVALLTLGVNLALADRGDRTAWLRPAAASNPVATQVTSTTYLDEKPVTVIRLASDRPRAALPAPPGMNAFPRAGTTWVSPALADRLADLPAKVQPFGKVSGRIGTEGLTGPDQLVAVVGTTTGDPTLHGAGWSLVSYPGDFSPPTPIAGFAGTPAGGDSTIAQYVALGKVATVLLLVPVLTLVGAAARLGAGRRAQRLATLRLAGASRRQLAGLTVLEADAPALVGGLAGIVASWSTLPLLAQVPVDGSRLAVGQLWPGITGTVLVLLGALVFTAASALLPLSRILRNPLAITAEHTARFPIWWRILAAVAAFGAFFVVTRDKGADLAAVIVVFAVVFAVFGAIGPVVLRLWGAWQVHHGHRTGNAGAMIAGRRLQADPRSGWRAISGLVLACFVAGFLALFAPAGNQVVYGVADRLDIAVTQSQTAPALTTARAALRDAGVEPRVSAGDGSGATIFASTGEGETRSVMVQLPHDPAAQQRARAAIQRAFPATPMATGADVTARDAVYGKDFRRSSLVVLGLSFLMAAASTGIVAAAAVLDRRRTYRRLWQAGVPLRVLDRARVAESVGPAVLCAALGMAAGAFVALPITKGEGALAGGGLLQLAATAAAGVAGLCVALRGSRGLLHKTASA